MCQQKSCNEVEQLTKQKEMHKLERDFYLAICTLFSTILLATCVYFMSKVKRLEAKLSEATKKNEFIVENRKA